MNAISRPPRPERIPLRRDRSGTTLVESAVILAVVVLAATAGVRHFGNVLGNVMEFDALHQALESADAIADDGTG